jgi:Family of unknown function (DUF6090)
MKLPGGNRRQLFEGKGFSKYLTYAIGEIVLVVIGILLALEISNWNEARKDREAEQVLLKGLRKEMMGNRDELVKAISYHQRSGGAVKKLMEIYRGDYRLHKSNELDSLFAEVQWAWTFDPRLGVLNSIRMTGKINTIQNQKLQSFISSFEEVAKDSQEESVTIKALIINQFMPIVNRYISVNERDKYLGFQMSGSKFPADYAGLFNDRAVESIIAYIYIWRIDEHEEEVDVLAQINEGIAIVEGEIEK